MVSKPAPLVSQLFKKPLRHLLTKLLFPVSTGGLAFEFFLDMAGSYTSHKDKKKFTRNHPGAVMPDEMQEQIIARDKNAFCAWVLTSINNMGLAGKKQMFFMSFTAQFHGLSRMGMSILASYGFMMKKTMFDSVRQDMIQDYAELAR
jgi:hypothetical protein